MVGRADPSWTACRGPALPSNGRRGPSSAFASKTSSERRSGDVAISQRSALRRTAGNAGLADGLLGSWAISEPADRAHLPLGRRWRHGPGFAAGCRLAGTGNGGPGQRHQRHRRLGRDGPYSRRTRPAGRLHADDDHRRAEHAPLAGPDQHQLPRFSTVDAAQPRRRGFVRPRRCAMVVPGRAGAGDPRQARSVEGIGHGAGGDLACERGRLARRDRPASR